jgi:hypothetical protein
VWRTANQRASAVSAAGSYPGTAVSPTGIEVSRASAATIRIESGFEWWKRMKRGRNPKSLANLAPPLKPGQVLNPLGINERAHHRRVLRKGKRAHSGNAARGDRRGTAARRSIRSCLSATADLYSFLSLSPSSLEDPQT